MASSIPRTFRSNSAQRVATIVSDAGEQIRIVAYDPSWPRRFEEESLLVTGTIGDWVEGGVHHVGSTAVVGLAAKPIIDIMVGVRDLERSVACIDLLAALDYCYAPYRRT